jgi:hypothetical protein
MEERVTNAWRARLAPGLGAGSIAGIVAVLVSLPLRSPHDSLMNSGTVSVAALAVSMGMAIAWDRLNSGRLRGKSAATAFAVLCAAMLSASLGAALAVQSGADLERIFSFVAPLAAIQFGVTALATPVLASARGPVWALSAVMVAALLVTGIALAGQGDQPSGKLELPPR